MLNSPDVDVVIALWRDPDAPGGLEGPESLRRFNTIPKHKSGADRSAERERQSSPPAHRGARVIRTDALRFMLILQEPRGGQERKQDSEDDPDINAHQSSPAAALPTNSSLTDGIYFDEPKRPSANRSPLGHATVGT